MKIRHLFIPILILAFVATSCSNQRRNTKQLKSIYQFQHDTIVGIEKFDEEGRLVFGRTSQIIGRWNNALLTWMTAFEFKDDQLAFEYYAHSNTGLRIKIFDYDQNGDLRNEYTRYFSSSNRNGRNSFSEISQIESKAALISYLQGTIPDSIPFKKQTRASRENTQFFKTYLDEANIQTKEYWTIEDRIETQRIVEKYNSNGLLIFKNKQTRSNDRIDHFKYDNQGHLIEEIEISDPIKNKFQKKAHFYKNGVLEKTNFFHGDSLAFTYEYFYQGTLLIKEIKTRITESEHFKNRKKVETIDYKYGYY